MKTVQIKGKPYIEVKERILHLAENHKDNYSVETEYEYFPERKLWVVKAKLTIGKNTYTGLAQEIESGDYKEVNSTSALENCETSAVGRACAMAGIGVIESIASADEVNKAMNRKFNYQGTQYENRKQTTSDSKIEFLPGDELRTGNKNGKDWFGIKRGKEMIWLKKDQYEYLSNSSQGENYESLTEDQVRKTFSDGAPLPSEF